jgi:hypothetical protein
VPIKWIGDAKLDSPKVRDMTAQGPFHRPRLIMTTPPVQQSHLPELVRSVNQSRTLPVSRSNMTLFDVQESYAIWPPRSHFNDVQPRLQTIKVALDRHLSWFDSAKCDPKSRQV